MNELAVSIIDAWSTERPPSRERLDYYLEEENYVRVIPLLDGKEIYQIPWNDLGYARCDFIHEFGLGIKEKVFYLGAICLFLASSVDSSAIGERLETILETFFESPDVRASLNPDMTRCIEQVIAQYLAIQKRAMQMHGGDGGKIESDDYS